MVVKKITGGCQDPGRSAQDSERTDIIILTNTPENLVNYTIVNAIETGI